MNIYLIRHGYTKGNEERRYVGTTDEALSEQGVHKLTALASQLRGVVPDVLLASPMRRCRETVEQLFPNREYQIVEDFRECNFGRFEYKNYHELEGDKDYQRWIDSGGTIGFPDGESLEEFKSRCQLAFQKEIAKIAHGKADNLVIVAHGGTIMAVLDAFSLPHQDYFTWQIPNGNGYVGRFTVENGMIHAIQKLWT